MERTWNFRRNWKDNEPSLKDLEASIFLKIKSLLLKIEMRSGAAFVSGIILSFVLVLLALLLVYLKAKDKSPEIITQVQREYIPVVYERSYDWSPRYWSGDILGYPWNIHTRPGSYPHPQVRHPIHHPRFEGPAPPAHPTPPTPLVSNSIMK